MYLPGTLTFFPVLVVRMYPLRKIFELDLDFDFDFDLDLDLDFFGGMIDALDVMLYNLIILFYNM